MATASKKRSAESTESSRTVITPAGIARYAAVLSPRAYEDGPPKFSLVLVFDEDADLDELKDKCWEVAEDKFSDAKALFKKGKLRMPWRDNDEYEGQEPFDSCPGGVFIKATTSEANPPGVVDARAKPIIEASKFYDGCMARMEVYPFAYDTSGNKGVSLLINNVQKTAEGEKLAMARRSAEEVFGPVKGGKKRRDEEDDDDVMG